MANWAVVEDGVITELHEVLPQNWRTVSNLVASANDLVFLAGLGWYPIQKNDAVFDAETHMISDWQYQVQDGGVYATAVIIERPVIPEPVSESEKTPTDNDLAVIRAQLSRWESTMTQAGLDRLSADIAQQDAEWRQSLRNTLQQSIQMSVLQECAAQISENLLADTGFRTAVANRLADILMPAIRDSEQINNVIREEVRLEYQSKTPFLQSTVADTVREYREKFTTEFNQLMQGHRDHLQGLVSLEEVGDPAPATELEKLRVQRNRLLQRSDWTQAPDVQVSMSDSWKQRWQVYRQKLRDLPQQFEDNNGQIQWPLP